MYSIEQIIKGIRNPKLALEEFNKFNKLYHRNPKRYNTNGVDVFSEDWDNLVLLDSCRYDYFEQLVSFEGTLESRISRGSMSREFIRGNFQDESLYDTVYVSANPWYLKISEEIAERRSTVYRFELDRTPVRDRGHVRDRVQNVTQKALEMIEEHPNKRLMIHYMRPHCPYVDEKGDILIDYEPVSLRKQRQNGDITDDDIRRAYSSSVQFILNHINKELLESLNGLTVITADHGELLGERMKPLPVKKGYTHPPGIYQKELVKVPWFRLNYEDRKEIEEESEPHPSSQQLEKQIDVSEDVNERLRDLGYKEI